ncbi:MAG: hypothetical protein ACXWLF_08230 [Myxococcaceae bacterium]
MRERSRGPVGVAVTSNTAVPDVYATGCVSGRDIALQSNDQNADPSMARALAQLQQGNTTQPPAALFGLPRRVSLLAIGGFYYAHKDLGAFVAVMGAGGWEAERAAAGVPAVRLGARARQGLLVSSTLFVAKHNADERATLRRAARAAGEAPPPTMLDHAFSFAGGKIGVAIEAANRERSRTAAAD